MKSLLLLLFLLTFAINTLAVAADDGRWLRNGIPAVNSEASKTVNGFGASVLITADPDWESTWNTPSEAVPSFLVVQNLKRGEQASILVFFANPALDAAGTVDVTFDLKITGPDKKATENRGLKGFAGTLAGPPTHIYLAANVVRFVGEPADPLGEWVVEVVVHDNHRHVSIPLRTRFTLTLTGDEQSAGRKAHYGMSRG
ncbi:hypothetical protein FO488_08850 [Geobacter sp. FeAm09]|uniref:hypothetical protein n=1 Tax=Geobacter sp. FeAm09 TaxID=2597769 RepID=UPI0011EC963A|nr:hypothetical protein [Geobacter sp. FeAm09]QEM68260.1 hypothetical protein FO488_08850 [Geobacter sp. FeAm09]